MEMSGSASALHYTIESLDEGLSKQNGHSPEVPEADLTNVLVDKAQMGLACVTSCGALFLFRNMTICQKMRAGKGFDDSIPDLRETQATDKNLKK